MNKTDYASYIKVDNTEIVVAKKEYLLLLFFDKCGLSFLWITRKLLHKWLTIYFSTLESPWKSSMMMTMFCAIAKKKPLTLQSTLYPHPFHFVLIWYLGVYHDGNWFFFWCSPQSWKERKNVLVSPQHP